MDHADSGFIMGMKVSGRQRGRSQLEYCSLEHKMNEAFKNINTDWYRHMINDYLVMLTSVAC